jgi:hypothetical protein
MTKRRQRRRRPSAAAKDKPGGVKAQPAKAAPRITDAPAANLGQGGKQASAAKPERHVTKRASWRPGLVTALVTVLAVTSSLVTLVAAPPLISLGVGAITVAAGSVGLVGRLRRHLGMRPWLGIAFGLVGLVLTGSGVYELHRTSAAEKTQAMRETCAALLDYEDAELAGLTAQLASNFAAPTVDQTQARVFDAVAALTRSANRSGSQEAEKLALQIRDNVVQEASTGTLDVENLHSRADRATADESLHALCARSSVHLSDLGLGFHPLDEREFCTSLRGLLDVLDAPNPKDKFRIADQHAYAHFYQVTGLQTSEDVRDMGVAVLGALMTLANATKDDPLDVRYLSVALDMAAHGPCAAVHVGLGHIGRPPLVITSTGDDPILIAAKLLQHLSGCEPFAIDATAPFIDVHCSNKSWSVKVFRTKAERDAWLSTHVVSSWRYVRGDPAWVAQVPNIIDAVTVGAELDGSYWQPK